MVYSRKYSDANERAQANKYIHNYPCRQWPIRCHYFLIQYFFHFAIVVVVVAAATTAAAALWITSCEKVHELCVCELTSMLLYKFYDSETRTETTDILCVCVHFHVVTFHVSSHLNTNLILSGTKIKTHSAKKGITREIETETETTFLF